LRVIGPGTEFNLEMPGSYRLMRIGLRGSALDSLRSASASRLDRRSWLMPGVHEQRVAPTTELELQQKLLRTVGFAEAAALRGHDLSTGLAVAASEAGAALAQMLSCTEEPSSGSLGSDDRRDIVDATLAIFEAQPHGPVSISAVCGVLAVGERTLERAFQERLGLSPRAYERERRLRAAHGLILTDGHRLSITDIAMSFGFWRLSRFAGAYAALFGCSPSETRRRIWGGAARPMGAVKPAGLKTVRASRDHAVIHRIPR
jgi:AraC-like DNA-binding protein